MISPYGLIITNIFKEYLKKIYIFVIIK